MGAIDKDIIAVLELAGAPITDRTIILADHYLKVYTRIAIAAGELRKYLIRKELGQLQPPSHALRHHLTPLWCGPMSGMFMPNSIR
jgi:hypothetical protein